MSEPELPDMATRTLIISHIFHAGCSCTSMRNLEGNPKCSRCSILDALRYCWPFDYLGVADVMARKVVHE